MNYLLFAGVLLNTALLITNRFVKHLPDKIYIPLSVIAVVCMIAGLIKFKL